MRLIDADALKEAFGERPYNWTDSPEEIQAVCDWDSAVDTIDNMPIINAIPVTWLKDKMQKPQTTCANPFGFVLAEWLEEQEEDTDETN